MCRYFLFIAVLFFVRPALAQQRVEFVNDTKYNIFVSYIVTIEKSDINGTSFPQLVSLGDGFTIPPMNTYVAIYNPLPLLFPYSGFDPEIEDWQVQDGTLPPYIYSGAQAMEAFQNKQKFYYAKMAVAEPALPIADGGNIGQDYGASQSYIPGSFANFRYSEIYPNPPNQDEVTYRIEIYWP